MARSASGSGDLISLDEIRELSERVEHRAPVECMKCSRKWEDGHAFVEDGLRELRAEAHCLEDGAVESDIPLRFGLQWLSHTTSKHLLVNSEFELLSVCASCNLERCRGEGLEWALRTLPG